MIALRKDKHEKIAKKGANVYLIKLHSKDEFVQYNFRVMRTIEFSNHKYFMPRWSGYKKLFFVKEEMKPLYCIECNSSIDSI